MADYDNELTGAMFVNEKRGNEKAPDRRGEITIQGQKWELAGWLKTSKTGTKFLSLKAQLPRDQQNHTIESPPMPDSGGDVPF